MDLVDDMADDGWTTGQLIAIGGALFILGAAATAVYYRYTTPPQTIETCVNPAVAAQFGATAEEREKLVTSLGKNAVIEVTNLIGRTRGIHGALCFSLSLVTIARSAGNRRASAVLAAVLGCPSLATSSDMTYQSLLNATDATVKSEAERGESAWDWLPATSIGGTELYQILKAAP